MTTVVSCLPFRRPDGKERHTRTSQVKAFQPEVVSVSHARTGFPLTRVLRHTASQPAGRFVDCMVQRQTCAISREVSARTGPTQPTTNRDSVTFHSDYVPPPPTSPQVSARRVRPARWHGPELPGVFPADPAPRLSRVSWNLSGGPRPPRHHQEGDHRDQQVPEVATRGRT